MIDDKTLSTLNSVFRESYARNAALVSNNPIIINWRLESLLARAARNERRAKQRVSNRRKRALLVWAKRFRRQAEEIQKASPVLPVTMSGTSLNVRWSARA